jgi:hypothetical protein
MVVLAGFLPLVGCATEHPSPSQESVVTLNVVDRTGAGVLKKYTAAARTFVAGEAGRPYALQVSNRSSSRVMVVLTVDGINVITGKTGDWSDVGYVLEPWSTHEIRGWRKSDREVASFEFTGLRDSYAARTGRPGSVGVIGMAEFSEKLVARPRPSSPPHASARESANSSSIPSAASADSARSESGAGAPSMDGPSTALPEKLGTGHGQREWSASRQVRFERATRRPNAITTIEYDTFNSLVYAGVIKTPPPLHPTRPAAFPVQQRYVPDPPPRW